MREALIKYSSGDLGGARTLDPLIKSQLLYQLSYEVKLHSGESQGLPS